MTQELQRLQRECSELKNKLQVSEQERKESEERFRTLLETSLQGVAIIQDNRFVFCTPLFADIIGHSIEEIMSFTADQIEALVHPDDNGIIQKRRQDREAGRPVSPSCEYRVIRKDGTTIWVQIFTSAIIYKGRPAIQSAFIDITKRKLAEKALLESESQFRVLFEQAGLAILIMDEQGVFIECNQKALEMFGCAGRELIGTPPWHFSPPIQPNGCRSQESAQEKVAAAFSSGTQIFEWTHQRLDSTQFDAEVALSAVQTERGAVVFSFVRDITERKRAEAALAESERRFRLIAETIDEVFWLYDVQKGVITYLSPAFERIWGIPREILLNRTKHSLDPIHPEDRGIMMDAIDIFRKGLPLNHEYRIVRPDGTIRNILDRGYPIFDDEGKVVGIAGLGSDVTDWRQAEDALIKSNEYLNQVINCMGDPIFVRDRSHKITLANEVFCQALKRSSVDIIGTTAFDTIKKERAAFIWDLEERVFSTGNESTIEEAIPDEQGKIHHFLTRRRSFEDKNKDKHLITIIRDVTDYRRLHEQFLQAQKIEAIGALAAGIAHDFNNILNVVNGYSDLVLESLEPDNPIRADIQQIRTAGQQAVSLTTQLLAFGRRQIIRPEVLNPNKVVEDMSKMLRRLVGENIRLTTNVQPDIGAICIDQGQIHQIIMNLAINARDAMPNGGQLAIETANVDLEEDYICSHPVTKPGPYVMLAVTDTGIGMNEETKSRLFEPFFTTKEKGKGTGLGLSTVYGIVKQNNGFIWVYSEPGKGTTLKIYLPRVEEKERANQKKRPSKSKRRGAETILLVEDESSVRILAGRILRAHGYNVIEASGGQEALRLAGNLEEEIHLLLSDTVMPGMNGKELAQQILTLRPGIKSLFTSGYPDHAIANHGVLDTKIAFLQKPFDVASLTKKVREVLDS